MIFNYLTMKIRRAFKRILVFGYCWGLLPLGLSEWFFDRFKLGGL
jgi:hypothetical protein